MRLASKSIRLEPLVRQTFLQNEKKSIHFCSGYREGNHFHKYTHAQNVFCLCSEDSTIRI
jgi:hypothetical protein